MLLLSFVRIANLCVMTQLVGSSNATYHYVSNRSHNRVFLTSRVQLNQKIGTRLQQAGKLITCVLLVAEVVISKASGAHQMFPGSTPMHGNSDGEMCGAQAGRCRRGERGRVGRRGLGVRVWAPVGPLEARQVQELNSTLSPRERLNLEFPAGRIDLKFEDEG